MYTIYKNDKRFSVVITMLILVLQHKRVCGGGGGGEGWYNAQQYTAVYNQSQYQGYNNDDTQRNKERNNKYLNKPKFSHLCLFLTNYSLTIRNVFPSWKVRGVIEGMTIQNMRGYIHPFPGLPPLGFTPVGVSLVLFHQNHKRLLGFPKNCNLFILARVFLRLASVTTVQYDYRNV